jgi:hypothetical protein
LIKKNQSIISTLIALFSVFSLLFLIPSASADDSHDPAGNMDPGPKGNFGWMCASQGICKNGDAGRFYPHLEYGYQCVWYAWNRLPMINGASGWTWARGNGGDIWRNVQGLPDWTVDTNPHVGWGASATHNESPSFAHSTHVAVVERVNTDGSITISEGNANGLHNWESYSVRTLSKAQWTGIHFFSNKNWKTSVGNGANAAPDSNSGDKPKTEKSKPGIVNEDALVGMSAPKELKHDALPDSPSAFGSTTEDYKALANLKSNSTIQNHAAISLSLSVATKILGIVSLLYGLILLCAFLFDRANTILDFSLLYFVSFHHYKQMPKTMDKSNRPTNTKSIKYISGYNLACIELLILIISSLLLSNLIPELLTQMIIYIQNGTAN